MEECEVCFKAINPNTDEYVKETVDCINSDHTHEIVERIYCDCLCLMMAYSMRFNNTINEVPGARYLAWQKNEMGITMIQFRKELNNHVYDQDS